MFRNSVRYLSVWMVVGTAMCLADSTVDAPGRILFDFSSQNAAKPWQAVNDGVMGGRSIGKLRVSEDNQLVFSGVLSLANNGGFASIRAGNSEMNLADGDVLVARVLGDGRTYQFNVYTQQNLGGYSFRQSFRTKKGEWTEVRLPVDQFVATWRGRTFPNQKFDPAKAAGLGILLGDKKPGSFELVVDWIKVMPAGDSTAK